MKHYINILLVTVVSLLVTSCDLETYDNGDLDGMWHLVSTETLENNIVNDKSEDRIYWSFQGKLLQMDDKDEVYQKVLFRFKHENGSLHIYNPYLYDRENGDKVIIDTELLIPFGVEDLEETYSVEALNGNKMILRSETLRLKFHKL